VSADCPPSPRRTSSGASARTGCRGRSLMTPRRRSICGSTA
jgi:hypothetical protein